jgi:hypothetical protein
MRKTLVWAASWGHAECLRDARNWLCPHLGSLGELVPMASARESWPCTSTVSWLEGMIMGELALVMWAQKSWQADQLSYHPGPDPGFEPAHSNIYPTNKLLEHIEGPVLQNQAAGSP